MAAASSGHQPLPNDATDPAFSQGRRPARPAWRAAAIRSQPHEGTPAADGAGGSPDPNDGDALAHPTSWIAGPAPLACSAVARLTGDLPSERATSAGGVVIRVGVDGPELILGLRRLDRDGVTWSLPKGTPEAGETSEETALREVAEETGLQVRIVAPVGDIRYRFVREGRRIDKTVHYYLMEVVGGALEAHDHEFDDVRWFPLAEAESTMTFPTEKDIVARTIAVAGLER